MNTKFRTNVGSALELLLQLRLVEGQPWKTVLKETGLSHSKAELAVMEQEAEAAEFEVEALTPEFVRYCREDLKVGWGPIMVWTQSTEGAVRDAWEKATNTYSDCQRVGHGGRWKFNEPSLYVGELKPTGTEVPTSVSLNRPTAIEVAVDQTLVKRLMALPVPRLRAVAVSYGCCSESTAKKWTPAKCVVAIRKAMVEKGVTDAELAQVS